MSSRTLAIVLALLLPACADSCGCGATGSPEAKPSTGAKADGSGAQTTGQPRTPEELEQVAAKLEAMRSKLVPMPESDERERLATAASKIDVTRDLGDPLKPERFVGALPEKVGDFRAEGAAQTGSTPAELGTATVAARRYRSGKSLMHVKITDTANSPGLRRELTEQLTMVGNEPSGDQKGKLENGIPGASAYHANARASRATALLAGRFFVEVMVEDTERPDVAWTAVLALDGKALPR